MRKQIRTTNRIKKLSGLHYFLYGLELVSKALPALTVLALFLGAAISLVYAQKNHVPIENLTSFGVLLVLMIGVFLYLMILLSFAYGFIWIKKWCTYGFGNSFKNFKTFFWQAFSHKAFSHKKVWVAVTSPEWWIGTGNMLVNFTPTLLSIITFLTMLLLMCLLGLSKKWDALLFLSICAFVSFILLSLLTKKENSKNQPTSQEKVIITALMCLTPFALVSLTPFLNGTFALLSIRHQNVSVIISNEDYQRISVVLPSKLLEDGCHTGNGEYLLNKVTMAWHGMGGKSVLVISDQEALNPNKAQDKIANNFYFTLDSKDVHLIGVSQPSDKIFEYIKKQCMDNPKTQS